jgi:hypothetical protein
MPSSERIRTTIKMREIASSVAKLANLQEFTRYLERVLYPCGEL